VLLSGTPLQNHLDEFYAMVDFCNPGALGPPAEFRRKYEAPILAGASSARACAPAAARSRPPPPLRHPLRPRRHLRARLHSVGRLHTALPVP